MPYIAIGWPELTIFSLMIAVIASLFNLSGNLCLVKAYQTSESSFLAPLDFLYLKLFYYSILCVALSPEQKQTNTHVKIVTEQPLRRETYLYAYHLRRGTLGYVPAGRSHEPFVHFFD